MYLSGDCRPIPAAGAMPAAFGVEAGERYLETAANRSVLSSAWKRWSSVLKCICSMSFELSTVVFSSASFSVGVPPSCDRARPPSSANKTSCSHGVGRLDVQVEVDAVGKLHDVIGSQQAFLDHS